MSNPRAEMGRDEGVLHITLFDLTGEQLEALWGILMLNGSSPVYEKRSEAGAHLDQWDSKTGRVSFHLHREQPNPFLDEVQRKLGVYIPRECCPDYRRTD